MHTCKLLGNILYDVVAMAANLNTNAFWVTLILYNCFQMMYTHDICICCFWNINTSSTRRNVLGQLS